MKLGSMFTGIGGFDLAFERAGYAPAWQIENEPYCVRVLERHWPDVRRYQDIREVEWDGVDAVDVVAGGFPCQDLSIAGRGAGLDGAKSGLWWAMHAGIAVLRPRWVVIENSGDGWRRWVPVVREYLGRLGYASLPLELQPRDAGLPHKRRSRVYLVAHLGSLGLAEWERLRRRVAAQLAASARVGGAWPPPDADSQRQLRQRGPGDCGGGRAGDGAETDGALWTVEPTLVRGVHGVSHRLDRVRALGNALIPALAYAVAVGIRGVTEP